jgi:ankyrin repeat protein
MDKPSAAANLERSMAGAVDSARLLLEFGVAPVLKAAVASSQDRILMMAAATGDDELLEQGLSTSRYGRLSLSSPIACDEPRDVEDNDLSDFTEGVNLPLRALTEDVNGVSVASEASAAVALAVSLGSLDVLKRLLQEGADPNVAMGALGATPLHIAAALDDAEGIRALAAAGI